MLLNGAACFLQPLCLITAPPCPGSALTIGQSQKSELPAPAPPQDRASFKQDPRFNEIMSDIEKGMFGDKEYFKPLVDSVSNMQV